MTVKVKFYFFNKSFLPQIKNRSVPKRAGLFNGTYSPRFFLHHPTLFQSTRLCVEKAKVFATKPILSRQKTKFQSEVYLFFYTNIRPTLPTHSFEVFAHQHRLLHLV